MIEHYRAANLRRFKIDFINIQSRDDLDTIHNKVRDLIAGTDPLVGITGMPPRNSPASVITTDASTATSSSKTAKTAPARPSTLTTSATSPASRCAISGSSPATSASSRSSSTSRTPTASDATEATPGAGTLTKPSNTPAQSENS